jgi:hypothetical protein
MSPNSDVNELLETLRAARLRHLVRPVEADGRLGKRQLGLLTVSSAVSQPLNPRHCLPLRNDTLRESNDIDMTLELRR